ncbi:hypothetical protein [Deinococcus planocerae]|uniref:hypothetical protein n=1 Tax=Deinococcus planocerae TaxID=1737569 RepID=UPI001FE9CCE8|nr:hypothetical protein [Deinococcus planocerae]
MTGTALDALDHRVREALRREPRVWHALAYGSRIQMDTQGLPLSDRWSDLEYWAFLAPGETLDPFAFLEALVPVALAVVNPFGTPNVVLPDLTRVELHAVPRGRLEEVAGWSNTGDDPERMLLKDRDGQLRGALARRAASPPFETTLPGPQAEYDGVLHGLVFGSAVLARGEELRAWDALFWVRGGLLRLARAAQGAPPTAQPRAPGGEGPPGRLAPGPAGDGLGRAGPGGVPPRAGPLGRPRRGARPRPAAPGEGGPHPAAGLPRRSRSPRAPSVRPCESAVRGRFSTFALLEGVKAFTASRAFRGVCLSLWSMIHLVPLAPAVPRKRASAATTSCAPPNGSGPRHPTPS